MKYFFVVLLLVSFQSAFAQHSWQKPDYKQIEKDCNNSKSNYYFKTLLNRYLQADTTLTSAEKEHLYYGSQFSAFYNSFSGVGGYNDSLRKLTSKGTLGESDYHLAIRYCDSILATDPLNLRILNTQAGLYRKTGAQTLRDRNSAKIRMIIDAIVNSGDGKTPESAFYVLSVPVEYDLINILGFEFGGSQSLKGANDYLTLKKNEYNLEGLYFDVSASFNSMEKMFKK